MKFHYQNSSIDHSYTFLTMPIMIFSLLSNSSHHPLYKEAFTYEFRFLGRYIGQLISKCPFDFTLSSKIAKDFCPESFYRFLRNSWRIFRLSVPGIPKKLRGSPQESTKNFSAKILTIIMLLFWSKRCLQKII